MSVMATRALTWVLCFVAAVAHAQDAAPQVPGDPHAAPAVDPFAPTAEPASDLPKGTLAVEVSDAQGRPHARGELVLGIMQGSGARDEKRAQTDANGHFTFSALPVGSGQAYRVNVSHAGAKFSSNPFRLPEDSGFRVRIHLRSTTRDDRLIFAIMGQTVVELRDDRLHVTQQTRVTNAGETVWVLPKEGLLVPLPVGFAAFQWQDVMTDQKATEVAGQGFRLRGSLPPGTLNLTWAYDVLTDGADARIPVAMPFRTYSYRAIIEAPKGLTLRVTGFPEAERVKDQGRELLFTQLRRTPPEAPLGSLTLVIGGIPGPGPLRWVAAFIFFLTVAVGLWAAFGKGGEAVSLADRARLLAERKAALLFAARRIEEERTRGDVGPEFHARKLAELETELAMVLREESR